MSLTHPGKTTTIPTPNNLFIRKQKPQKISLKLKTMTNETPRNIRNMSIPNKLHRLMYQATKHLKKC